MNKEQIRAALELGLESASDLLGDAPRSQVMQISARIDSIRFAIESLAAPSIASSAPADELPPLPEPLEIYWPELHSQALGCGVEDRNIHDRYEAAEYGWQDGVDKTMECVPDAIYDADQMRAYAVAAIAAQQATPAAPAPNMDDWNVQMSCVKALLNCTDGELECTGPKLLDSYIADVKRVVAAALASLPVPPKEAT